MLSGIGDAFTGLLRRGVETIDKKDEREFLPAALEVLETPPSPAGRALALIIGLFFTIALTWAFVGKVDVLATAPGRILPAGKVKIVQPLDSGIVKAIHVQEGDHVTAGQLLVELDPTSPGADRDRLIRDLATTRLEVERLTALKLGSRGDTPLAAPPDATDTDVAEARAALRSAADQQAAKLADLDQQIAQKRAEAAEDAAETAKNNASLPMLIEKDRLHRQLREKGYGTSFAALDAQQELSDARHQQEVLTQKSREAEAAMAALERQRDETVSEFKTTVLSDLAKAEEKENQLAQDLVKAQEKSRNTELRAPIDGVVEELAVHTIGGVVTPAEKVLIVVPDTQALTVEAQLPNRDIGFVHAGQDVAVKVETYNFQRYGMIHGKILEVSRDASLPSDRSSDPTSTAPQERPGASPTYTARISLEKTSMIVEGKRQFLRPGMAVTAEIKTGRRTIIDYLLSPIARKTSESLHER
jgi:hemolysin D